MTTDVLLPWVHSAGGDGERKSMQAFHGNGTTGPWEFSFAGGYIDQAHVKAYRYDPVSATSHPQALTFIGPYQIKTADPIPSGQYIVIYRDTPKDKPLVDYNEGAVLTEKNLDTTAQQAVFAAAEMVDRFDTINTTSNEAIQRSLLALDTANTALDNSNTAMADAADAVTTADAASAAAASAVSTANTATAVASGIDAKAQTALDNSVDAVATANAASATAAGIDAKATQAQTDAASAVSTANAAMTAANDWGIKANIDSPALTGTPTAPTPQVADNSPRLATTAYVKTAITQDAAPKTPQHQGVPVALPTVPASWNDLPNQYPYTGLADMVFLSTATNAGPQADTYYYLYHFFHYGSVTQFAIPYAGGSLAWRYRNSGAWSAWGTASIDGHKHYAHEIVDSSSIGRGVLTTTAPAYARALLGAGTSNLTLGYSAGTAKPGDWSSQSMGVGSYMLAGAKSYSVAIADNNFVAGSNLRPAVIRANTDNGSNIVLAYSSSPNITAWGTWRNMSGYTVSRGIPEASPSFWGLFMRVT